MSHSAKAVADSVSSDGVRLTTLEVTFPRIVLAEFNTHRVFSRNSASSRAIPVEKMLRMVEEHPYVPTHWGQNQKGMQAYQEIPEDLRPRAERSWLAARDSAVAHARDLLELKVHKQVTNRLLEPFMWHTVIVTATEWSNWTHLRDNPGAHPEIARIARLMGEALEASTPRKVEFGDWHLPYIRDDEFVIPDGSPEWDEPTGFECTKLSVDYAKRVSTGRCARVSYLTHDGRRDVSADIGLHDSLLQDGHMSPFEHVARPMTVADAESILRKQAPVSVDVLDIDVRNIFCGNFRGWVQYRKEIPHEEDVLAHRRGAVPVAV